MTRLPHGSRLTSSSGGSRLLSRVGVSLGHDWHHTTGHNHPHHVWLMGLTRVHLVLGRVALYELVLVTWYWTCQDGVTCDL